MENENTDNSVRKQDKRKSLPHLFQKGQSGNPAGRPKGSKSLKQFAKEYLLSLSDDKKIEFLNFLPPDLAWRMAEGNPEQKSEIKAEINIKNLLDELSDSNTKEESK